MNKLTSLLTAVLLGSLFTVNAENYKIPVGEFDQLLLSDNINVVYTADMDKAGFVCFEAEPAFAPHIMADCRKGKLRIQLAQEGQKAPNKPTVYAYSSFLSTVENMKDSTIIVNSIKPASEIKVEVQNNGKIIIKDIEAVSLSLKLVTGRGNIIASGKCKQLNISNLGTGIIEADDVEAQNVKCKIMGTGTIGCHAVEALQVSGMGTGKVYYKGKPESIKTSKIGPIKLIPIDKQMPIVVTEEPVEVKKEEPKPVEVKPVEKKQAEPVVVVEEETEEEVEQEEEETPSITKRQRVTVDEPTGGASLGIEL